MNKVILIVFGLLALRCTENPSTPTDFPIEGASTAEVSKTPSDSIITNQQYLPYLSVALNYDWRTNNEIQLDFTNYQPSLPEFNDFTLSSSASRQFTNLAYRACLGAYNQDISAGQRVVFRFLDTSKAPAIGLGAQGAGQVDAFLMHLATRITGKVPSPEELNVLRDFYKAHTALVTQDSNGTREVSVASCTVLASSAQTLMRRN